MSKAFFLRHRDLLTASLLGFSSGYVTSNTKTRFDTFGGMMTGNTVKLGMSLQATDWPQVGVYVAVIGCFAIGTECALIMLRQRPVLQRLWLAFFCSLFVIVDGVTLALRPHDASAWESAVSGLAALALGAQNCLSQKSNVVKANTSTPPPGDQRSPAASR